MVTIGFIKSQLKKGYQLQLIGLSVVLVKPANGTAKGNQGAYEVLRVPEYTSRELGSIKEKQIFATWLLNLIQQESK